MPPSCRVAAPRYFSKLGRTTDGPDVNTPVPLERAADHIAIGAVEMIDGLSCCCGKVSPGSPLGLGLVAA